jgi:hypothetical protein
MRGDITFDEAGRALREAFDGDDVRVDMVEPGRDEHVVNRQEYERRLAESKREKVTTQAEEAEYREFASLLGITDDEPPMRMVTMPQAEYDKLKAESDKLGPMLDEMRRRPTEISPEEEAEYQAFLSLIGPV